MTIFRIATFTIPVLFFIIFSMPPPASAIVPNDMDLVECTDIDQISLSECNALVALYEKMDGLDWNNNENWRKTDEPCDWYGITCDEDKRRIIGIRLEGKNDDNPFGLKGALPAEIGELVHLQKIDFTFNELTTLPPEIGNLKELEVLRLSHNFLESLPQEIGALTNLREIYLCENKLEDAPKEIGNLRNLEMLYFDHNELSEVPAEVGNLPKVEVVRFNDNKLTALPAEIGNLSQLKKLYINNNKLTALPSSFTALTDLVRLDAGHNHLVYAMSYDLEDWLTTNDPDWRKTQTEFLPTETPTVPMSTPPPLIQTGDLYESDDTCSFARILQAGGAAQPHTFHQAGDEDWIQVNLQKDITYTLLARSLDADAKPEVEIYPSCDGFPDQVSDPVLGNDTELVFTPSTDGTYYVRISNRDSDIFGEHVAYKISMADSLPAGSDLAIIITGHDDGFSLQTHIFNAANRAYKLFSSGGISKERIRYLGIEEDPRGDGDNDGVSDMKIHSTLATAKEAITQWPIGKVDSDSHIFIYLVSHGLEDIMMIDGKNNVLEADVLDQWLDQLENDTGASVVVVYEACRAGSFITGSQSISKPGRIVITSTDTDHNAYPMDMSGAHFSDAFFSILRWGKTFEEAFEAGRTTSLQTLRRQNPMLDDNGDGRFTTADGKLAEKLRFSRLLPDPDAPIGTNSEIVSRPDSIPALGMAQSPQNINNGRWDIQVQANNAHYVKMVWANVYPPVYEEPETTQTGVPPEELNVERIELYDSDDDGIYEGTYGSFNQPGNYRFVFYGYDMADDAIMSTDFNITIRASGDEKIYLPVIIR